MFEIISKEMLSPAICRMKVYAPRLAASARPGQFLIVIPEAHGERIPLTISDYDAEAGTVTIVTQRIGVSTGEICSLEVGDRFSDVTGPLGHPSDFVGKTAEELSGEHYVFIAGGVGTAPVYPQVKYLHSLGVKADVIIGAKTSDLLIYKEEMAAVCDNLHICTDDGSEGFHGMVTGLLEKLVNEDGKKYTMAVAIGPMIMMKFATLTAKKLGIPMTVSLNTLMVDGTGMCGACRVTVAGKTRFACVEGPEFNGYEVDFDEAMRRQGMYRTQEHEAAEEYEHECKIGLSGERKVHGSGGQEESDGAEAVNPAGNAEIPNPAAGPASVRRANRIPRVPVREQDPKVRATNFEEVCYGYDEKEAMLEATRCLHCKNPRCVAACPVNISIPEFIAAVADGDFAKASAVIARDSSLPAVCGRVCPQETQCEGSCILGVKSEPVAIGKLERFVADWNMQHRTSESEQESGQKSWQSGQESGQSGAHIPDADGTGSDGTGAARHKVAVVGSGPSGLACAADLAKLGYDVTVFEALHKAGGVLEYGIPEFRLPKERVVAAEINQVKALGVKIETDVVIGRTLTVDSLLDKEGFSAVFIGSGAGLPRFMNIPGENLNGVFSANEFLTRNNLMHAYSPDYRTPVFTGRRTVVVGGGNVAMDAARTALRLGAKTTIVYRRTENELPARREEVHHAKEEGVEFMMLSNPVEILGDDKGWVRGIRCIRMELGEPDESGRRSPVPVPGSEFEIEADSVIMALGTSPNPLISHTTSGLETNRRGCIVADEDGATTRPGVFAGGDAVTGAATVILAMGAGRKAAAAIDRYIRSLD